MPNRPSHGHLTAPALSDDCLMLLDAAPDAMLVVNQEGTL